MVTILPTAFELRPLPILGTILNDSSISRYRDLYKEAVIMDDNDKTYVLLLGLENQSEINYGMVIRNMLYDALSYQKQIDTF